MERHLGHIRHLYAALLGGADEDVFEFDGLADIAVEHLVVEVGVGDCGEEGVDYEMRGIAVGGAFLAEGTVDNRHTPDKIQELVHPGRGLGFLSADTLNLTPLPPGCLLTLITEHFHKAESVVKSSIL